MARTASLEKHKKRIKLVNRHNEKRAEYKKIIKSSKNFDEIIEAQAKLAKLPVNSNPIRINTRCQQCGRVHAVYRKFGLCRICLRQQLMSGNVTGGRKSSW